MSESGEDILNLPKQDGPDMKQYKDTQQPSGTKGTDLENQDIDTDTVEIVPDEGDKINKN